MTGLGGIVVGAAGGLVLLLGLLDVFTAVFNYDGFTFLAGRVQSGYWRLLRGSSRLLGGPARAAYLSLGSAAMLPLTLLWWLALEVAGFAMMYLPGLAAGDFATTHPSLVGAQGAFYLSGGDLTSLTFGDVVARAAPFRALVDLETVIGLATFTIGLTYVLAAFDAVGSLNQLHGRVRRQAIHPNQPATILARHFRAGEAQELSTLLQSLVEDLAAYDDALRRYPLVFYFHTRRRERSIPRIYTALGQLIELLRWGLPPEQEATRGPYLLALEEQYRTTGSRLLRSFVGPAEPVEPGPVPEAEFARELAGGSERGVAQFRELREQAARATGIDSGHQPLGEIYRQYVEWLNFHEWRTDLVRRLQLALCYDPEPAS